MTPGRPADLTTFTDPRVKKAFVAKPAIHFPANLAIVRVQASGYRSESVSAYGNGAYSVITTRDIEKDEDIDKVAKLPGVGQIVALNRLLLPSSFSSDLDLREAAAKLQADAIVIYTIETEFQDNNIIPPLTTLSLGLAPNKHYKINAAAAAIVMDTKTGYIYGALEENDLRSGLTIAWAAMTPSSRRANRRNGRRSKSWWRASIRSGGGCTGVTIMKDAHANCAEDHRIFTVITSSREGANLTNPTRACVERRNSKTAA